MLGAPGRRPSATCLGVSVGRVSVSWRRVSPTALLVAATVPRSGTADAGPSWASRPRMGPDLSGVRGPSWWASRLGRATEQRYASMGRQSSPKHKMLWLLSAARPQHVAARGAFGARRRPAADRALWSGLWTSAPARVDEWPVGVDGVSTSGAGGPAPRRPGRHDIERPSGLVARLRRRPSGVRAAIPGQTCTGGDTWAGVRAAFGRIATLSTSVG